MPESLHIEVAGQGAPLVLLHGWGMHGGMFRPLYDSLTGRWRILAIDLPGHGYSEAFAGFADLPRLAGLLLEHIRRITTEKFTLLGWSLGGLLAQYLAATNPQYVTSLVLVAATPCFQKRDDWSHGIDNPTLMRFTGELLDDYRATLSRFLALQFFGAADQRETLRKARELLFARPAPTPSTLQQGLQLLQATDLRTQLREVRCPTLLLNGERDTLVPVAALRYSAEHLPAARAVIVRGAGHAPFLSHTRLFTMHLQGFFQV